LKGGESILPIIDLAVVTTLLPHTMTAANRRNSYRVTGEPSRGGEVELPNTSLDRGQILGTSSSLKTWAEDEIGVMQWSNTPWRRNSIETLASRRTLI